MTNRNVCKGAWVLVPAALAVLVGVRPGIAEDNDQGGGIQSTPDLSGLSREERESIQSVCSSEKYLQGLVAYNRCVASQLSSLKGAPRTPDLIRQVRPRYPALAKQVRIQGTVILEAVISKRGFVENLRVVKGHPLLIQRALDAVKQWRYKPTVLNGVPVEVITRITVNINSGLSSDERMWIAEGEYIKKLLRAAEQGDARAQYTLGFMYYEGEGVPEDTVEAVKWLRKAAEQGDDWAQHVAQLYLCFIYFDGGQGVPKDYTEAVKWYRMVAEQDPAQAQLGLGQIYEDEDDEDGVPKDDVKAYAWYILADAQGNEEVFELKDSLRKDMTAEQVAEAQELADELREHIESSKSK